MEKLLDLLDQNVEIQDSPNAKELVVTKGELEFGTTIFDARGRCGACASLTHRGFMGRPHPLSIQTT